MVYVDEIRDYGPKGKYSHMWTDGDIEELHTFAIRLGLKRTWLHESKGLSGDFHHYDVVPSKRELALKRGAVYMPLKVWITSKKQKAAE